MTNLHENDLTYGARVRAARKDQRLSQRGYAANVGVSSQYLCDIEFGRRTPGPEVAGKIYMDLGVRLESPTETQLREALRLLVDAMARDGLGDPLPAEEWFALRDYAYSLL